jgi:hypothetical protein
VWLAITGGTVTRRQLARYLDVSDETLTRDLRKLCASGYLVLEGRGRASQYRPGPRVASWGDFEPLVTLALDGGVRAVVAALKKRLEGEPQRLF